MAVKGHPPFFLLMICILLLFKSVIGSNATADTIKVAGLEWRPFMGEQFEGGGFCLAVVKEALARTGHEMDVKFVPWTRSLSGMKSGAFTMQPAVWYEESRTAFLEYTIPYESNRIILVSRRQHAFRFKGQSDLNGKRVGIARDYSYPKVLMEAPGVIFDIADSPNTNLKKLRLGRIDLTVGDAVVLHYEAIQAFGSVEGFYFDQAVLKDRPLYMTVSKAYHNHHELVKKLNESINAMKKDGTINRLLKKYQLN